MAAYRGGYLGIVKHRAFDVLMGQTVGFLLGGFFFAGARMLLGMGLMKLGCSRPSGRGRSTPGWPRWATGSACR